MAVRQVMPMPKGHGVHDSHFYFPLQLLLGLIFTAAGLLWILKQFGRDYLPFIPNNILIWACAIGSLLGGAYLIITIIWKPRIYIS